MIKRTVRLCALINGLSALFLGSAFGQVNSSCTNALGLAPGTNYLVPINGTVFFTNAPDAPMRFFQVITVP